MKRSLIVAIALAASFAACAAAAQHPQGQGALDPAPAASTSPPAKVAIISDIDDTFRMTNVLHKGHAAVNLLHTHAFAGMSALYAQILKAGNGTSRDDLYFVSGAPREFNVSVVPFLNANHARPSHLIDRSGGEVLHQEPIATFKERAFKNIFVTNPNKTFVFLGDDTEQDPCALDWAFKNFKGSVAGGDSDRPALYIHKLQDVMPPKEGQTGYTTALEVALYEMAGGRMLQENVRAVANAIRDDAHFDNAVFPDWGKQELCPTNKWISKIVTDLKLPLDQDLQREIQGIEDRVIKICTSRREKLAKHGEKSKPKSPQHPAECPPPIS